MDAQPIARGQKYKVLCKSSAPVVGALFCYEQEFVGIAPAGCAKVTTVNATHARAAIERAADLIDQSDALIIAAGAGMGVDSGLPDFRGEKGFWQAYPALERAKIDFYSIANPILWPLIVARAILDLTALLGIG